MDGLPVFCDFLEGHFVGDPPQFEKMLPKDNAFGGFGIAVVEAFFLCKNLLFQFQCGFQCPDVAVLVNFHQDTFNMRCHINIHDFGKLLQFAVFVIEKVQNRCVKVARIGIQSQCFCQVFHSRIRFAVLCFCLLIQLFCTLCIFVGN